MTNLLPPHAKKQIVAEYWTRVVCVWVILWSACLLVGVVLLWPTYVLLTGNNAVFAESATAATERVGEYEDLSRQLTTTSKQAEEIVRLSQQAPLSQMFDELWAAVDPETIEVASVGLQRVEGELQTFSITGKAADRQSLARFRDALEAVSFVSSVNLPIDNLAKNENISYSLTVKVIN